KGGKVAVRDFDSTNGTFINEKQIKGEASLTNEDVLRVGPLSFRVLIEGTPPVNKPTPPPKLAAATATTDDDSVAAMLLSLQDEAGGAPAGPSERGDVPAGSTVMDMMALGAAPSKDEKGDSKTNDEKKDDTKSGEKKDPKASAPDTRAAAAAILEKYT